MLSSSQQLLISHLHQRVSCKWWNVNVRETAHQIAAPASRETYHARTYVFAVQIAKMILIRNVTITNQMMTVMVNIIFFQVIFLIDFRKFIFEKRWFLMAFYLHWHIFNGSNSTLLYYFPSSRKQYVSRGNSLICTILLFLFYKMI